MSQTICPLCGESVDDASKVVHREIDEWLLQLVLQDHPDWKQSDGACGKCWKDIARLKREADQLQYTVSEAAKPRTGPADRRDSR